VAAAGARLNLSNVLILSLVFPPDSVSTAEIMGDLAVDLRTRGHDVAVLTTTPHYNRDPVLERAQPLSPHWGPLLRRSDYGGIPVFHVPMPAKTRSVPIRLLGWVGFHAVSVVAGAIMRRAPDVILVPSPPLSNGVAAWIIGRLRRAPFIYNVQEIYPDIAINLGALRSQPLIRMLSALERFVYRKAAAISVIAPRMRERLVAKGVPAAKIDVIPNFVDLGRLAPTPRLNEFSRRCDLDRVFTVTYAGNIGPAQGLEIAIDAARLLSDQPQVRFLIIGEGMMRKTLEAAAATLPSGVQLMEYQPNALMPQIYGASDLCLVTQAAATGSDAIPSKVYRIMASGRPVVAVTESSSDLAALVRSADCGAVVEPGDAAGLAAVVRDAVRAPGEWQEKAARGRAHVAERYDRGTISDRYDALIRQVVGECCAAARV